MSPFLCSLVISWYWSGRTNEGVYEGKIAESDIQSFLNTSCRIGIFYYTSHSEHARRKRTYYWKHLNEILNRHGPLSGKKKCVECERSGTTIGGIAFNAHQLVWKWITLILEEKYYQRTWKDIEAREISERSERESDREWVKERSVQYYKSPL